MMMDLYDVNDIVLQVVVKLFYQGLFGFDKDMKFVNVFVIGYEVSFDVKMYMIKLCLGVKFYDGIDFNVVVVKVNFDCVIDFVNYLKCYNMFCVIEKIEVVDLIMVKVMLCELFLVFINMFVYLLVVMILLVVLKKWGCDIVLYLVGIGLFEFVEWKQIDDLKVKKFVGYWKKGYLKIDVIDWKLVVDNNMCVVLMKMGEVDFVFCILFEQVVDLKGNVKVDVVEWLLIVQCYVLLNMLQKLFDNLKVCQVLNYVVNKEVFVKVVFFGFVMLLIGVVLQGVDYVMKFGFWLYDLVKVCVLLKEVGYLNGFEMMLWFVYNNLMLQKVIQFVQQQFVQVGVKVQVQVLEVGECVVKVESVLDLVKVLVWMYYIGWLLLMGEVNWVIMLLLVGVLVLLKFVNIVYYKNDMVDGDLMKVFEMVDCMKKVEFYVDVQKQIWVDVLWIFFVQEKIVYVCSKWLQGVYVMLDGLFNFDEILLK